MHCILFETRNFSFLRIKHTLETIRRHRRGKHTQPKLQPTTQRITNTQLHEKTRRYENARRHENTHNTTKHTTLRNPCHEKTQRHENTALRNTRRHEKTRRHENMGLRNTRHHKNTALHKGVASQRSRSRNRIVRRILSSQNATILSQIKYGSYLTLRKSTSMSRSLLLLQRKINFHY